MVVVMGHIGGMGTGSQIDGKLGLSDSICWYADRRMPIREKSICMYFSRNKIPFFKYFFLPKAILLLK